MTDVVSILQREFLRRSKKNSSYSLRAFAQSLDLPSGRLSEFMNRKRPISKKMKHRILCSLGLSEIERRDPYHEIDLDRFEVISDPIHFSLLSLIVCKDFKPSAHWISRRLGVSTVEVNAAVDRLKRIGLLNVSGNKWKLSSKNLKTPTDRPSDALKIFYRKSLSDTFQSLDRDSIDLRDFSSMTLAIEKKEIPKAKKLLKEFRRLFTKKIESDAGDAVYRLNLQFVPVTKEKKK